MRESLQLCYMIDGYSTTQFNKECAIELNDTAPSVYRPAYKCRERGRMQDYPPDLTPKLRAELLKEISTFDEKATRAAIEREAVGKQDIDAYQRHVAENQEQESVRANPDILSEGGAVKFERPVLLNEDIRAKSIIDGVLPFRERQVWRLVMRRGYSYSKTASLLRISENAVRNYLARARKKVKKRLGGV